MIRIPRIRLGGPIEQRDATVLLAVAAALVIARIPSGFLSLLVLPLVVLLVQGYRPAARWPRGLRLLFGWCLVASALSSLLFNPIALTSTGSNVIIMVAVCLTAAGTFGGGRPRRAADRLVDGLYWGLVLTWALSVVEVLSGFKFSAILYPDSTTTAIIARNRFFVSAFFPNYNDYSVAMVMLVACVVAKMLLQPRGGLTTLARWAMLLSSTLLVAHMGSRGSLVAMLLTMVLLALTSVRIVRPGQLTIRHAALASVLGTAVGGVIWQSPYVQDNSTAVRGRIADNIGEMLTTEPVHGLLGWPSLVDYVAAAQDRYGSFLMDPHNLLLEIIVRYGLFALPLYLWCWWRVAQYALRRPEQLDWRSASAVVVTLLMPLLGIVSSSTLRYHVFWLWLVVAMLVVQQARRTDPVRTGSSAAPPPATQSPEASVAEAPSATV